MLTVFAVIGVIFTVLFIVFSIENANKNNSSSNRNNNSRHPVVHKNDPRVILCALIIENVSKAVQNNKQIGWSKRRKTEDILSEHFLACVLIREELSIQFNLPVPEIQKYIDWSFDELKKTYFLK